MNTALKIVATLFVAVAVILGGWILITLNYTYSTGERAGYVQKISKRGWICKTWEGELAMANLPGAMPQIFTFSVLDEEVAHQIEQAAGQRVSLTYEQHPGIPTDCFGDTEYFIVRVTPVNDAPVPGTPPAAVPVTPAAPAPLEPAFPDSPAMPTQPEPAQPEPAPTAP